jgi:hypothetical protein
MLKPIEGGRKIVIQDHSGGIGEEGSLAIEVWLPPEGYGHYYNLEADFETGNFKIIDDIQPVEILNGDLDGPSLPDKECKWYRQKLPIHYKKKIREEEARQQYDPNHLDPDLEEFREREWHRREYGLWFWNYNPEKGIPDLEYITGQNYYYLVHHPLDTGYADFRKPDQEYYYFRRHVEENFAATGMVEATRRRAGKTFRGGEFVLEYCSRNEKVHGGIQSKNEADAKKNVFRKAVVDPFRKAIDTFKPIYDESKGDRPSSELSFFNTNRRGQVLADQEEALESWIDWVSSDPIGYDGYKLHRYLHDECFKRKDSIYELYNLIKPCFEDKNGTIVGKALFTSTVEEMNDEAMAENIALWDESDQSDLDEYGETKSGLYRFFTSALDSRNVDEYGYAPREENRKYYQTQRDKYTGKKLAALKRKYPFVWQEAFASDAAKCIYDPIVLQDSIERRRAFPIAKRGNLHFHDRHDWSQGVYFKERHNGRFQSIMGEDYDPAEFNNFKMMGSQYFPIDLKAGMVGVDPYDIDYVKSGKGSDGAGCAYRSHHVPDNPLSIYSDNFTMIYIHRPATSAMFYEDMMKMCLYTGYRAVIEDNKVKCIDAFIDNNMGPFLYTFKGSKKPGINANSKTHKMLMESTEAHIEHKDFVQKNGFIESAQGWLKFDPKDTQTFDLEMCEGWCLVGIDDMKSRIVRSAHGQNTTAKSLNKKHQLPNRGRTAHSSRRNSGRENGRGRMLP